jgi:hypothetical protein
VAKFETGKPKTGGKKKGTPNKVTKDAKALFVQIMEGQVDHVEQALNDIREKSPFNYILCFSKLAPYFMPKQIDIKSDGEKLQAPVINIQSLNENEN